MEKAGPDPRSSILPGDLSCLLRRYWPLRPGLRQWTNCDFGGCQVWGGTSVPHLITESGKVPLTRALEAAS